MISWIKAAWEEVSGQIVISCFPKCDFRSKVQDGDVQTLDQDTDEEFANLVKELAGDVELVTTWILTGILLPRCQKKMQAAFSGVGKFEKKSFKTQLTRLWMYQAMKT